MTATVPARVPATELAPAPVPLRRWDPQRITTPFPLLPLAVLIGLSFIARFEVSAFQILTPEIKSTYHLSLTGLTALTALTAPLGLLLDVPVGYFGDRLPRMRLAAIGLTIFTAFTVLTGVAGVVGSLALLYVARAGVSVGSGFDSTYNSLISDYYPPEVRTRAFYAHRIALAAALALGPALIGVILLFAPWQVPFVVLAVPAAYVIARAFGLGEPIRGLHERRAAGADELVAQVEDAPAGLRETFRTLFETKTARRIYFSLPFLMMATLGIAQFTNLLYDEVFHVGAAERGFLTALGEPGQIAGLVIGLVAVQRIVAVDPGRAMRVIGLAAAAAGATLGGFALAPTLWSAWAFHFVYGVLIASLLPGVYSVISLAVPPRMRTLGFATGSLWLLLGIPVLPLVGVIGDAFGIRAGTLVFVPVYVLGSLILGSAGRFINADIARNQQDTLERAQARLQEGSA